jgi:thiamine biosynthesis lipoprotein
MDLTMPSKQSKPKLKPEPSAELHFEAIGTHWFIELPDQADFPTDLITDIQQTIHTFDSRYSRFRPDSFVTRLSKEAGNYILPEEAQPMLDLYQQLYQITNGLMTPLIGQTLSDAGYDADYSLVPKNPRPAPPWEDTFLYAFPKLTMYQPALLDFGAAGKGYLVDILSERIENHAIKNYLVNGSGDIRIRSSEPIDFGLEHPDQNGTFIATAHLSNQSLCGSSGNRRTWGTGDTKYHHIINAKTVQSPSQIRALWVIADTTLLADGLTTALFFTSAATLHKHFNFEYAIIYDDYSLEHSKNFPADFYTDTKQG